MVLSVGILPQENVRELAQKFGIVLNEHGFYQTSEFAPVEIIKEGIFMAGTYHAPKFIDETIAQASAAVSRACTILSKNTHEAQAAIACVNEDICSGCRTCKTVCSCNAIEIVMEEGTCKVKVADALCKGCGACVAACPSDAMEQKGFKSTQLLAMVDAALE